MIKRNALYTVKCLASLGETVELRLTAMDILLEGKAAFDVDEYAAPEFDNGTYRTAHRLLDAGCEWERTDADGLPCATILAPDNRAVYIMTCKGARACYSVTDYYELEERA